MTMNGIIKPGTQLQYQVTFTPGTYRYYKNPTPPTSISQKESWLIGRIDTQDIIAFTFTEEAAKHVCLALNLVHHYIHGNTSVQMDILKALEKFRH